jgi:cation-transporting ATPase 13A1
MSIPFAKRVEKMQKLMKDGQNNRVTDIMGMTSEIKFGDACIAAPFTSKHSNSIHCVLIVIRQAITTLVTTMQTYKILGISSLLQAYSLAEMNMVSLKYSETQTVAMGILGAINFYFFSNAKPMKKISHVRAPHTIFNFWYLLSLFGQVAIYLSGNYYAMHHIGIKYMPAEDKNVNADAEFAPSFVNTVIFLFTSISQSLVFLITHGG